MQIYLQVVKGRKVFTRISLNAFVCGARPIKEKVVIHEDIVVFDKRT